ncbi:hypothetical protein C0Z20_17835 [Trinickia symbiotica]|uniref:Uncharacterized protein n=2 Tax=Trinickia symbiotica TaxID=863227 RepID=A0A2N7X1Q2_9BURK|nr:hypothetical protein [Trinickia symbiotica]PMS35501.1 hypothetical protein C0Z20_17835 [Trinickia symbiotica]
MTPERFGEIVQAYGGDARRWPAQERASAESWAAQHRHAARALLDEAERLDAYLARDLIADPSCALERRILADAGARRPDRKVGRRLGRWLGHWWPGAALAGVGLAGGVVGALAVSLLMLTGNPPPAGPQEPSYLTTAFGPTAADGSAE